MEAMSKLLTKYDFDAIGCDNPQCDHADHNLLYLHSQCHPNYPLNVCYDKRQGVVIVSCHHCHEEVARILPAIERLQ
jgi:hypothetical protein